MRRCFINLSLCLNSPFASVRAKVVKCVGEAAIGSTPESRLNSRDAHFSSLVLDCLPADFESYPPSDRGICDLRP